eukprot:scaffold211378_cov20-Cyclotella_meneghiniana.AAC.1
MDNILHSKNNLQGHSHAPSTGIKIDSVNIDDIRRSVESNKNIDKNYSSRCKKPVESNKNGTTSKVGQRSKQPPQKAVANVEETSANNNSLKSNSENKMLLSKITSQEDVRNGKDMLESEKSSKLNSESKKPYSQKKKTSSPKDVAKAEVTPVSKKSSKSNNSESKKPFR